MSRLIWSPAALLDVKQLYDFLKVSVRQTHLEPLIPM